jgi:hypothetical protein
MTFAKPEKDSYRGGKIDNDAPAQPKPCSMCHTLADQEDLIKYGSWCFRCYDGYCRRPSAYIAEPNKYPNDPKGWAKRLIDKHNAGLPVAKISLEFAKEVVK